MSTQITLNGEATQLVGENVTDLLVCAGLDPTRRGIAVAVNGAVVPRREWPRHAIRDGDLVEIVKPFAGG